MDPRSQSDSDGGGGHHGRTPPSNGSPAAMRHDEGRPQPGSASGGEGPADGGQLQVLSLEQIRITGSTNEYTEGPTVAQRSPATPRGHQKSESLTSLGSRSGGQQETPEERPNNLRNLHSQTPHSNSAEDSQSSVRTSVGSSSSAQRFLSSPPGTEHIVRSQPKACQPHSEELKPLHEQPRASKGGGAHSNRCEDCGRCRCPACRRPRELPSCLLCDGRCVCSAPHAVEYCTCVCCVKGLFYHCSSDEEDTCSDKPFSCTQSHRCARWATVALLAPLLPCILCYLPAKGCVAACESCYDRAARPGCRCRNSKPGHREDGGKLT